MCRFEEEEDDLEKSNSKEFWRFVHDKSFVAGMEYADKLEQAGEFYYQELSEYVKANGVKFDNDRLVLPDILNVKNAADLSSFAEVNKFSEVRMNVI